MKRANSTDVKAVLTELDSLGSKRVREDMGKRFGIHTDKAWGVMMRDMKKVAKAIGIDHALAQQLWRSGWYEARMVATMIADPMQVTPKEMQNCGWLQDRFGMTWQVVPERFMQMVTDRDPRKVDRVMAAMMPMKKLDIAKMEKAFKG